MSFIIKTHKYILTVPILVLSLYPLDPPFIVELD